MRLERTRNAVRNIVFGVILRTYSIFVPFLMRTAMIYFMGVEYLGLNSLFTSILQVLNLAELGVGSAMVYSMYKPIAEDDRTMICALLKQYRTYYRAIGLIIAVVGIALTAMIPKLIRGEIPDGLNVYFLYWLNLGATVASYWLFAYKSSLFAAHQRVDIISKVTLVTNTFQYILQLGVLFFLKDYYVYLIVALIAQVVNNLLAAIVAGKMYPDYKPYGEMDKDTVREINHRIGDLFTAKVGGVIVSSVDTIVISAFLGLTVLAVYQNYYFILTAVIGFVEIVLNACLAGIGNSLIAETKEKNYSDLCKFTFLICWIAGLGTCCFLNLYQPFMELWVGKNLMLEQSAVICFCIYYYVYEINRILNVYKDAGGIWHKDRFRPLITSFVNLSMNLIMVQFWGIYGVLLSTILSTMFVGMPWLIHNLFTTLFDRKLMMPFFKKVIYYTMVAIFSCVLTWKICKYIYLSPVQTLIVRLIICCLIPNAIYVLAYNRKQEFLDTVELVSRAAREHTSILNKNGRRRKLS